MDNATQAAQDSQKLKNAAQLLKQNKLAESETLYKELITSPHVGPKAKGALGVLYLRQGKTSDAERLFKSVIDEGHQVAEAFYGMGFIHEPTDPSYARAQYEFALRVNPKHRGSLDRIQKLKAISDAAKAKVSVQVPAEENNDSRSNLKPERLLVEGVPLPNTYVVRYVLVSVVVGYFLIWFIDLFNNPIPTLLGVAGIIAWVVVSERNRRNAVYKIFESHIYVSHGVETKAFELNRVTSIAMRQTVLEKILGNTGMFIAHVLPTGKPEHVYIPPLASASQMNMAAESLRSFHTNVNTQSADLKVSKKFPLSYAGTASSVRYRTEQRGNRSSQVHIIEFRLQRAKDLVPIQVHMAGFRMKGSVKDGDLIVLKDRQPKDDVVYETNQVYNESAGGYVVMS
jgi:hypothetical protein